MESLSNIRISKENLTRNISEFKKLLPKGNKIVAVVKANAYGHGLKEIVQISEPSVDYFQVDDVYELIELRKYSEKPVLVLGYVALNELETLVREKGILGAYNIETLERLNEIGKKNNLKVDVHLKIDAFLGRQGILAKDINLYIQKLKELDYISLNSIYSHFSNIEDVDDLVHAQKQFNELLRVKRVLKDSGFADITHHISATSGFLTEQMSNWEGSLLRLGIGMYGLWPSEALKKRYEDRLSIRPVLAWISKLAQVKVVPKGFPIGYGLTHITSKETKIGIVPQGYSDGYDRGFSNKSSVLVAGVRCKVLGRIAMNMFAIDLSEVVDVKLEDEVVILGTQDSESIGAEELAGYINTINYEIIARISPLLQRIVR